MTHATNIPARRFRGLWLVLPIAGLLAVGLVALPRLEAVFLARIAASGEATLRISAEGFRGALRRFEPLPALIADRPILTQLLRDPENSGLLPYVNEQLRLTARSIGASDVYVMDASGLTIAASSYRKDRSFVGRSFAYRPYFTEALTGGVGRFHALGTTSGERGVFYAAPVLDGVRVLGVVAVKFTVEEFEEAWRGSGHEVLIADRNGIVFMASRPDWLFRSFDPLAPGIRDWIAATRQYPLDRITPLGIAFEAFSGGARRATLDGEGFVEVEDKLEASGFTLHVLAPAAPARAQAVAILALVLLAAVVMGLAAALILMRRARILERLADQRAQQDLLERTVTARTEDLRREIEDRKAAEDRLRSTQKQLVQAGKLAALGQMAAALSHEINQPLAAVKSYAENAATFLDRNRTGEARENVSRISQMADRMATISGGLRNFARRPQETTGPVPVAAVIEEAVALMDAQIRKRGARVTSAPSPEPVWALGGRLRLQQVVVNLLSNALDAMEDADSPVIDIRIETHADRVRIDVGDRGPGLPDAAADQVFDPFYTTKAPGKGLGLGLSISFNIVEDFGGTLSARNREGGGAVFSIELVRADAPGQSDGLAAQ